MLGNWRAALTLFFCLDAAAMASDHASATPVQAHFADQRVSLTCLDHPLENCLREVSRAAGIRFEIPGDFNLKQRTRFVFSGLTQTEAVLRLLRGYSFVTYPLHGGGLIAKALPASGGPIAVAVIEPAPQEHEPRTLNEFRKLPRSFLDEAPQEEAMDPETISKLLEEDQRRRRAAILERALDAFHSPYKKLHVDALADLVSVNDPRATSALIDALNQTNRSKTFRQSSAEYLLRHAVSTKFLEPNIETAFNALSKDPDPLLRSIAERGVAGYAYARVQPQSDSESTVSSEVDRALVTTDVP